MQKCKAHGYVTENDTINNQYEDEYESESEIEYDTELEEKESDKLDRSGYDWLHKSYQQTLGSSSSQWKKQGYDLFNDLVKKIYPANILQEASGMMAPLGNCPSELNEDLKW